MSTPGLPAGIELVPLARMTGDLGKMETVADTPLGHRIISGMRNVRQEGERLKASRPRTDQNAFPELTPREQARSAGLGDP